MTIYKKLTSAQQSRLDYQKLRFATPLMDALPLEIHPDNPLLPATADDPGNQVPRALQGLALKVNVPRPPRAGDVPAVDGYIELMWKGSRLRNTRQTYVTPIDPATLVYEMTLPEELTLEEGEHELSYYLWQGGNIGVVTPVKVNVDRTGPLPTTEVIVPSEVDRDGITKKYLDDNGFVLITVPDYVGRRLGDVVRCYIGSNLPLGTLIGEVTRTDLTIPLEFKLTAPMLDDLEGLRAIHYNITDRKGNPGLNSPYKRLNVTLTDPPENLQLPDLPQYSDSLIDLGDAQVGVGVGIVAEYTNYLEGDQLSVTWDGELQAAVTIPGFPFYATVPFRDVFNNDAGDKTVEVSYQIKRKSVFHPLVPLKRDIDVDLRKPGAPVDPTNPGNPNPNLALVSVQGSAGGPPNVLTAADNTGPVVVTAAIYPSPKENDEIQLHWKGVPVSEADGGVIKIGTTPPANLTFNVAWSVIDAAGNGNPILAHYVISHDVNDNVDISLPRNVDVLIRPGTVPKQEFQHLDPDAPSPYLNCGSLRTDAVKGTVVEVLVLGGEAQLADQELTFIYQGYTDAEGANPKAGTKEEVKYTPTSQDAVDGFIVKIPYDPAIKTTENAWGDVTYSAVIDGRITPSGRHLVRVYVADPSNPGGTCPLL
nr:hypothetical protein [uncultured Pseudomonas sp.]